MRTMYDSVNASAIPANAAIVAGYVDGIGLWKASDWARFPNAVKIRISSLGTTAAHVLDCEPGNPNATSSVNWVQMARAAGYDPYVYTAEWAAGYRWQDVVDAFRARKVALPHWWKAPGVPGDLGTWDGTEPLMVQTTYPGAYDVGVAADYLPGIEGAPAPGEIALPVGGDAMFTFRPKGGCDLVYIQPGTGNVLHASGPNTDNLTQENLGGDADPRFPPEGAWDATQENYVVVVVGTDGAFYRNWWSSAGWSGWNKPSVAGQPLKPAAP